MHTPSETTINLKEKRKDKEEAKDAKDLAQMRLSNLNIFTISGEVFEC